MELSTIALHLIAAKYFQIAAMVMFAYDYMLTLGEEVELIWMRPLSFATMLFFLIRYVSLMQSIVLAVSLNDPDWKGKVGETRIFFELTTDIFLVVCTRYAVSEAIFSVSLIALGQLIMILRVVAIYRGSKKILVFLLFLWTSQLILSVMGLRTGFTLPLPRGFVGCSFTGTDAMFSSMWIAPAITDSFVFLLTVYRTKQNIGHLLASVRRGSGSFTDRAISILLRDGALYYFVIFLANVMNALFFFLADPGIKPIAAPFNQLLLCTVVSRLVLNLRSLSRSNQDRTTIMSTIQFSDQCYPPNQLGTPKQLDSLWNRTLNDFTEDGSSSFTLGIGNAAFDEAALQSPVEVMHGDNDNNASQSHHKV
ncbi:hypothetical protein Agabi119p4_2624 [Agaricus bisporus var. burnettii]|uniref:DUF6533 domain-containing protein n=1 Tax=Agaricus bisporus var. burnettii TaxID=192524 RepID=A0A8H7F9I5_AGABI|nr:hypothetical protein Agabi119p4_2624 [Agaricus bisporus var. burnettii]